MCSVSAAVCRVLARASATSAWRSAAYPRSRVTWESPSFSKDRSAASRDCFASCRSVCATLAAGPLAARPYAVRAAASSGGTAAAPQPNALINAKVLEMRMMYFMAALHWVRGSIQRPRAVFRRALAAHEPTPAPALHPPWHERVDMSPVRCRHRRCAPWQRRFVPLPASLSAWLPAALRHPAPARSVQLLRRRPKVVEALATTSY